MGGLIFHLIAHTHWDREWYLPRAAFQARLVPALDDLLSRLQEDPAYRSFLLDGQTVLLEDYLRARPEREPDVRALVKTGRLQVGPWYVLADEQIPSGESLIRNLLLGAADAERLGGRLDVLYSPDAFGHPAAWPALAREFGIRAGVLWRGRVHPDDAFRWAAADGREVVTWQLPPQGYEIGAALPSDPERLAATWPPVRAALVERARGRHVAVFIGADHHATRADLPRLREALAALEPEHAVRVSRLDEFLQGVSADAAATPLYVGELRWSYGYSWTLQGVHGTRLPLKRRNAEAELWLERFAEPLAALARRHGGRDRRPLLDLAWRTLVRGHFHDAIAGCASDEVAAAVETRLANVEAYAREISRGALHQLIGYDADEARERAAPRGVMGTLALWNPTPRPRGGVVIADLTFFRRHVPVGPAASPAPPAKAADPASFTLRTAEGRAVPLQVLDRRVALERREASRHYPDLDEVEQVRVALRAPTAPGLGFVTMEAGAGGNESEGAGGSDGGRGGTSVRGGGRTLVNRFVEVELGSTGALTLHDRRSGERFSGLLRVEDGGDAGDTYSYCPPAHDRTTRSAGPVSVRRLAAGPLVAALEARWRMPAADLKLIVMLHADSPLVRCTLEINNRAINHRMRARIPTGLVGDAFAGTAFGAVTRSPVTVDPDQFPQETPVATAPAHRFVAAAAGRRGVALLAPGFFEYEWTGGGDLVLTLFRAVGELSRDDLPTRPGHAGWPTPTPQAQCLGPHRIPLALVPVTEGDLARGDVVPLHWEEAFLPPRGYWLREETGLSPMAVAVTLEGTGLVPSAVKPAQTGSGMVLRCYNATNRPATGAWRFGDGGGAKTAHRVRADEREPVALVLEERGRTVRFTAGPGEIVTIWVT